MKIKLLVVVGPTASGKTGLAMRIAQEFDGEIIAADSQTVKRGLDIGTAKPTQEERAAVKHHLIDVIDPYERFTAGEFKRQAEKAINEIYSRGRMPIIVGGSGMYIDALLYDFTFREVPDKNLRNELEEKSVEDLQKIIVEKDLPRPENWQNKRHLVRTLETRGEKPQRAKLREGAVVIGMRPPKEVLHARIEKRVEEMVKTGFIDEVDSLLKKYGHPPHDFDAIGYKIALENRDHTGNYDIEKIRQKFIQAHKQYAKRQLSWFKRNKDIQWFEHPDDAFNYITQLLSSKA